MKTIDQKNEELFNSSQNNCSSFEAFKPQFRDGLCRLINNASLNSKTFQLSALSKMVVLSLICDILNDLQLTLLSNILNMSMIWL